MSNRFRALIVSALAALLPFAAWSKVEFDSSQLVMKNADEISELVRAKIKKAQKIQAQQDDDGDLLAEPEAVDQLRDAMRIVLARPDQDGTRANAFNLLRRELSDLNSFESVLEDLAREAISAIRNEKTAPGRVATYIVVLENLMAELKPELKDHKIFRRIVEEIRDAQLAVPDKVKQQQLLRSMSVPSSPSETAAKILPKN